MQEKKSKGHEESWRNELKNTIMSTVQCGTVKKDDTKCVCLIDGLTLINSKFLILFRTISFYFSLGSGYFYLLADVLQF